MKTVLFLIFLAFIPAFAVLGHDAYLYYMEGATEFKLSAAGFLLTRYSPETRQWVVDSLNDPAMVEIFDAILTRKAVEIAGAFGVVVSCLVIVVKMLMVLFEGIHRASVSVRKRRL